MRNATVSLGLVGSHRQLAHWSLRASAEGEFVFEALPAGTYSLSASAPGYGRAAYGERSPAAPGEMLSLRSDERVPHVVLRLWRNAVIAGVVRDDAGEPLVGLEVLSARRTAVAGQPSLVLDGVARTNDRGEYRLRDLAPGEYVVAVPSSARQPSTASEGGMGNPTIYFPDVYSPAAAAVLTLAAGGERDGIDMRVPTAPTASISGIVTGGATAVPLTIRLLPVDSPEVPTGLEISTTLASPDGRFAFPHVPQGDYLLRVVGFPRFPGDQPPPGTQQGRQRDDRIVIPSGPMAPIPDGSTLWAETRLEVGDKDVRDVVLTLQHGARISGHVVFDGSGVRPTMEALGRTPVLVQTADGRNLGGLYPMTGISADGTFASVPLPPGKYTISLFGDVSGWVLESIVAGGREVAGASIALGAVDVTGVDVTLTDRPAQIGGTIHDRDGRPFADAAVYAFPTDRTLWVDYGPMAPRLLETSANGSGSYRFGSLLPGDYFVVALGDAEPASWRLQDSLAVLSRRASIVHVGKSEQRVLDLGVAR